MSQSNVSGWLPNLIGPVVIAVGGAAQVARPTVNFVGCTAADNPAQNRIDITPPGVSATTPWHNVPRATKTAAYTIASTDFLIVCATNTGFAITLPNAPTDGDCYAIVNLAAGVNTVNGGLRNVGPSTTYSLAQYAAITVTWDATETVWLVTNGIGGTGTTPTGTGVRKVVAGTEAAAASLVLNADVDPTAAIAGTKVAPNFGAQNIATTGAISLGTTTAASGDVRLQGVSAVKFIRAGSDFNALSVSAGSFITIGDNTSTEDIYMRLGNGGTYRIITTTGHWAFNVYPAASSITSAYPITGETGESSPWSGLNGSFVKTLTAAQSYTLVPADYAMSSLEFVSNGANIVILPAVTTAIATYCKFIQNVSGGGTITIKDSNAVAAAAALASGTGAWFRVSAGAVKQITAAFTVA